MHQRTTTVAKRELLWPRSYACSQFKVHIMCLHICLFTSSYGALHAVMSFSAERC